MSWRRSPASLWTTWRVGSKCSQPFRAPLQQGLCISSCLGAAARSHSKTMLLSHSCPACPYAWRAEVADSIPSGWSPVGPVWRVVVAPQEEDGTELEFPRELGMEGGGTAGHMGRQHVQEAGCAPNRRFKKQPARDEAAAGVGIVARSPAAASGRTFCPSALPLSPTHEG